MLIRSKFHDYYDSVLSTGIDTDTLYIREEKDFRFNIPEFSWSNRKSAIRDFFLPSYKEYPFSFYSYTLGFCGELYPFIEVVGNQATQIFYDFETFKEFKEKYKLKCDAYFRSSAVFSEAFFDKNSWKVLNKYFLELKTPVFITERHGSSHADHFCITANPRLVHYDFQKIKDPYSAFQDIYMYLSGVLGSPEKEMIQLSDIDMRDKKGFDKWSFKKLPSKKL